MASGKPKDAVTEDSAGNWRWLLAPEPAAHFSKSIELENTQGATIVFRAFPGARLARDLARRVGSGAGLSRFRGCCDGSYS